MSRFLSRAVLPLALAALAAACTPANTRPGASVPTAVKTGQSWVVTRPVVAAHVLDTCSRSSPGREPGRVTGYWAPSRQQVEQLEAQLPSLEAQVPKAADFDRQYVGIEMDGRQLIYLNAFHLPDDADIDPARDAIRVCDGGAQFWGAVFDPASGSFSDVQFNGPPAGR
ncbi:hypothetical protein [Stenotrophomonas bentonitica]|uniref:hypothetical protein n=1 Tax=Stenotrophomonas bentonitica TaxID=1450134 RepID=UPI003D2F2AD5